MYSIDWKNSFASRFRSTPRKSVRAFAARERVCARISPEIIEVSRLSSSLARPPSKPKTGDSTNFEASIKGRSMRLPSARL